MKNNLKAIGIAVLAIIAYIPSLIVVVTWNMIESIVDFTYDVGKMTIDDIKSIKNSANEN